MSGIAMHNLINYFEEKQGYKSQFELEFGRYPSFKGMIGPSLP
ncbi:MAG: hypothetical protein ABIN89_08605 [Chitinophagaceae bacterium]